MPSTTSNTAAPSTTTQPAPHPYVAHALRVAKAAKGTHTMPQWAALTCGSMGLPTTAKNIVRVGRYLRGQAGRATGNGVGHGGQYPPTTGAQLAALLGYGAAVQGNATPQAYTAAQAASGKLWATARTQHAQAAQARAAKAQGAPQA